MQVGSPGNLSGCLSYPPTVLILPGVHPHKIYTRQVHRHPILIHRPRYIVGAQLRLIVGVIIGIAPRKCPLEVIHTSPRDIYRIVGQTGPFEIYRIVYYPAGIVVLIMELILGHIPYRSLRIFPHYVIYLKSATIIQYTIKGRFMSR